jgi:hypothetical protein
MTSSAEVLPAASPASGELLAAPGSLLAAGERVAATCATPRAVSGSACGSDLGQVGVIGVYWTA